MTALTTAQQKVLDFILSYHAQHQTLPTKAEIQTGLGYKSYNAVVCFFKALYKKGALEKSTNNVGYIVAQKTDESGVR